MGVRSCPSTTRVLHGVVNPNPNIYGMIKECFAHLWMLVHDICEDRNVVKVSRRTAIRNMRSCQILLYFVKEAKCKLGLGMMPYFTNVQ